MKSRLHRLILVSGLTVVTYLIATSIDDYWSGVSFKKSIWPMMLAPVYLVASLGVWIGCVYLVISILRRKTKLVWLFLLVFPVFQVGIHWLRFPKFVDGVEYRLKRDFKAKEFHDFAKQARSLDSKFEGGLPTSWVGIETLRNDFPHISDLSQRDYVVTVEDTYVDIVYSRHCRIMVMDRGFFDSDKVSGYRASREALPGVWVCQLSGD